MWLPLAHSSLHQLEFTSQYGLLCISTKSELGILQFNLEFIDIKCDKMRTNMVALECVVGNGLIISEHVHST